MVKSLAMILHSLQLSPASHSPHSSFISRSLNTQAHTSQEHLRSLDYGSCSYFKTLTPAQDIPVQAFTPFDNLLATIYRYREQRSVNLGSWFVHERWMTGSDFKCAVGHQDAELDVAMGWGSPQNAKALLEKHWDEFIAESDFQYLASIGINTVRLPIGFWNLPGSEYKAGTPFEGTGDTFAGSWARIIRAINWANTHGIGVLVDLHGAAGSQNGQSHSGVSDGNERLFESEEYMEKTISALTFLSQQFCGVTNVVGIELLNEPSNHERLPEFYTRGIDAMRKASSYGSSCPLYIHDGFDLDRFTDFVSARKDFVVLDYHSYFVFTPSDSAEPASGHTSDIQTSIQDRLEVAYKRLRQNMIVGEWSCALTPESLDAEQDHTQARKDFCMAQYELYSENSSGHHFWSYKVDHKDEGWSFRDAVSANTIPQNFAAYKGSVAQSFLALVDTVVPRIAPSVPALAAMATANTNPSSSQSLSSSAGMQHRAVAIHLRRQTQSPAQAPEKPLFSTGYLDGFEAAKMFAKKYSKLGFKEQYIHDRIENLKKDVGSSVKFANESDEEQYRDGFKEGLNEAEAILENF